MTCIPRPITTTIWRNVVDITGEIFVAGKNGEALCPDLVLPSQLRNLLPLGLDDAVIYESSNYADKYRVQLANERSSLLFSLHVGQLVLPSSEENKKQLLSIEARVSRHYPTSVLFFNDPITYRSPSDTRIEEALARVPSNVLTKIYGDTGELMQTFGRITNAYREALERQSA